MPKFLEKKLKKQYGEKSDIPYKVMNKLGYMHGNKETAKGAAAQRKHDSDEEERLEPPDKVENEAIEKEPVMKKRRKMSMF